MAKQNTNSPKVHPDAKKAPVKVVKHQSTTKVANVSFSKLKGLIEGFKK